MTNRRGNSAVLGLQDELFDEAPVYKGGVLRKINNYIRNKSGTYLTLSALGLAVVGEAACGGSPTQPTNDCRSKGCSSGYSCQPSGSEYQCVPISAEQSNVSGYARRILHEDGGGSTITFSGAGGSSFAAGADGAFSGNVTKGLTYNVSVTGDHRGATTSFTASQPQHVLNFWMVDNDDMDQNSPYRFDSSTFDTFYRNGSALRRWDSDMTLKIYKGLWDQGIIRTQGRPATTQEILNTIEAAAKDTVAKLACGKMRCVGVTVQYVEGIRNPNDPAPTNFTAEVYARKDSSPAGLTGISGGNQITGSDTSLNVNSVGDLVSVTGVTRHETARALSGYLGIGVNENSILNRDGPYNIYPIDLNCGKVAYSLPVGSAGLGSASAGFSFAGDTTMFGAPSAPTMDVPNIISIISAPTPSQPAIRRDDKKKQF